MTPSRRVYEMRVLTGAVFSLPIALLVVWYAWSAFASMDRYRRAADKKEKLTLELFQLALHDELNRDIRRLVLAGRPEKSAIPTYELSLTRDNLDALAASAGGRSEEDNRYVRGFLKKDGEVYEARVRYRGSQPWHVLGVQKSMKVRLDRGDLLEGARTFNFINDPTPFGLEDQIILDLARESGLLTPEYRPVWLRLNNADLGVFRYEAQPDEGLLRRNGRMPGSMYSGDADTGEVFSELKAWTKVAWTSDEAKEDLRELERFLGAVEQGTYGEFQSFAEEQIDVDRYAKFDALDVVFGGNQHDWLSNHKFYVDPYTGKFEPVAWSFRGFQHERELNLVDHPLLIRLKMTPGYLAKRNRAVYELLTGKASVPEIRARVDAIVGVLAPELAADPYWDAYKLLPNVSRFFRYMPRPMSVDGWALVGEAELDGFAERSRFLLDVLEEPGIDVRTGEAGRIDVTVRGEAAYALRDVRFARDCAEKTIFADVDLDGLFDPAKDALMDSYRELSSGARLVLRDDAQPKRGKVRVETEPRTYTYFTRCPLEGVSLELENLVTGGSMRLSAATSSVAAPPGSRAEDTFRFEAGARSPHPWRFAPKPKAEVVELSGIVPKFEKTARYGAHQTIHIAPNTYLTLDANASLIFHGPVFIEGPVFIAGGGGIALQGRGTRGSRIRGLYMRNNTRVKDDVIDFPAPLNIHDTSDIVVDRLAIEGNEASDDVVHVNAVDGLSMQDVVIGGAPVDGIDLELSRVELGGVRIYRAKDDCLDIGGSNVRIRDSVLLGCKNNGVSAGELTDISMQASLIADAEIGVLAKNGSQVRAVRSVIWGSKIALKTSFKEVYYARKSIIGTSELWALECGAVRDAAKNTIIEAGSVHTEDPDDGALGHLRVHVLGLEKWNGLEERISELRKGLRP